MKNTLPTFILAILNFAVSQPNTLESENKIYLIDYHARLYAKQNEIDYESLQIIEDNLSQFSPQEKALLIAHAFTNPKAQTKGEIKSNLIVCKSFLKTL